MSDAKVIRFPGITRLDLPPEQVLDAAREAGLESAVIIGFTKEGEEYFASSLADGADVLWLIERAKLKLLRIPDEMT
jgi:hypothetical protein